MFEYTPEKQKVVNIPNVSFHATFTISWKLCTQLVQIIIGDDCFYHVEIFSLNNLNALESITIGERSFTTEKESYGENENRSFHITSCKQLTSIQIGKYSFSDYSGEFELKSQKQYASFIVDLPKLTTIEIGTVKEDSMCFFNASFVCASIFSVFLVITDLPSLKSLLLGNKVFAWSLHTILYSKSIQLKFTFDLPQLESIHLGEASLFGTVDNNDSALDLIGLFEYRD